MAARSNGTKKRMADTPFKDHFSKQAAAYQTYRPHYPEALFRHIASHVSRHEMAWDCATGNGQAAHGMVPFFDKIIATDASEKQIEQAAPHPQIEYLIAPAEDVPLQRQSMDLVLVAQALHWFDWPKFYDEVRRVVRPGGLVVLVDRRAELAVVVANGLVVAVDRLPLVALELPQFAAKL